MHLRSFSPRAWVLVGALVFALDAARADVALSSAPLSAPSTSAVLLSTEPFVNPFGTKKPKIVSGFGKRSVMVAGLGPGTTGQMVSEVDEGVDYRAFPGSGGKEARSRKSIFLGFFNE